MKNWALRWAVNGVALAIVAHLNIGVRYESIGALAVATVTIGLANSVVRPVLGFLTMPLNCMTFGLFGYALSFILFYMVGQVVPGFEVTSAMGAVLGSLMLGIISGVLSRFVADSHR